MERLHAAQNVAQDAHGCNYIRALIEHDALRALAHRRIRDLRAGWNAVFRKRFENLGCPDNRHMRRFANPEDLFLHFGEPLIAALDRQIASCNHDPDGTAPHRSQKQPRKMVKSLASFDLQNNPELFATELSQMSFQLKDV